MLVKEYRIPLPLSVDEYQVAQLYMIAKKSREETRGTDSGVEILVNEPYSDGPGGNGQYTHKIYHIGSHLPGWLKALLPKSALVVEEEAWNAYPYTKTRYTCPFVEKFALEIETRYINGGGTIENVFQLTSSDLKQRIIDVIDIVKDPIAGSDYKSDEDPTLFISEKTKRGPLSQDWIEEYSEFCKNNESSESNGVKRNIMCAYKLCRVEFKYWGMQSKIERFIHDSALRRTMLRAHRQAWAWQDEWIELTIEDIRQLEKQTQEELAKRLAASKAEANEDNDECQTSGALAKDESNSGTASDMENEVNATTLNMSDSSEDVYTSSITQSGLHSHDKIIRASCLDLQMSNLIMETIVQSSDVSSEDEFFDAEDEEKEVQRLARSSSEVILECAEKETSAQISEAQDAFHYPLHVQRLIVARKEQRDPCSSNGLRHILYTRIS